MSGLGLYHLRNSKLTVILFCLGWVAAGCAAAQPTQGDLSIGITADGHKANYKIPPGSTVEFALLSAGLSLGSLDRTTPPLLAILREGDEIQVVRVTESFDVKQEIIPFESQVLRNESLPQDQEYLIQKGKNGVQEITYRHVFEDGIEIASQPLPVKVTILDEPVPEIRMVGIQIPFAPLPIPGRIIYLRDGNVWMMEKTTANRSAILTTGDLDGRIFEISNDGTWLLFSRNSNEEDQINALWVTNLQKAVDRAEGEEAHLIDLGISNVIHFAGFSPVYNDRIIFSTVEPRKAAPGWQANNDLVALTFSDTGWTTEPAILIDSNAGGIYGWWGMDFSWSPDGKELAYTRPDGTGLVDFETGTYTSTLTMTPYQTGSDWAWVPGISWAPDSSAIFTVDHPAEHGSDSPEASQNFDLAASLISQKINFPLVAQVGMFAYPLASPLLAGENGEVDYKIAYLQALVPDQSETSRYRLALMNRDGSVRKVIFPADETSGLQPSQNWGAWSPAPLPESGNPALVVIHQGNLWIVDTVHDNFVQITGDELTNRVIWTNLPIQTSGN